MCDVHTKHGGIYWGVTVCVCGVCVCLSIRRCIVCGCF